METEVQLSDHGRSDADRWGACLLRRHGGNFYALDAATGKKLWGQKIDGAIGGGVITYTVSGAQKVAVATGYVSPAMPTEIRRAKVAILGVEGG